jgi:hypothetical protein
MQSHSNLSENLGRSQERHTLAKNDEKIAFKMNLVNVQDLLEEDKSL